MIFSEREGFLDREILQIDKVDETLSNGIWNTFIELVREITMNDHRILKYVWTKFFIKRADRCPDGFQFNMFKEPYDFLKWYRKYDLLEFCYIIINENYYNKYLTTVNGYLKICNSAWRMNGVGKLYPITNKAEIEEIERASRYENKFEPVSTHIKAAIAHFSRRPIEESSYRNSVGESIHAMEALCRVITNKNTTTGGVGIKMVCDQLELHKALGEGYSRIYGFSSNAEGIRHALCFGDKTIDFDDAKYFLVSISAFVNYLIAIYERS